MRISLIFSIFVVPKNKELIIFDMRNLNSKFEKILEVCKNFSKNLVNEQGNAPRRGPVPRFSDLEVIALSLTAEQFSIDSECCLFNLLEEYKSDIPNLISRRQYNDRRKFTSALCEQIRKNIAEAIDGGEDIYCIDSKPIPVCRLARAKRCKMGKNDFSTAPSFGFCASQNTHFFGYKLHALCGLTGVIHSYDLSKAAVDDRCWVQDLKFEYQQCTIIGDKGYLSAAIQLDLFETSEIRLEVPYRLNQKNWKPAYKPFTKARKRVETLFSQLDDQFMVCRNYAKQQAGLFARIIGKISALTVLQYINFINNKPLGRIKYALN